MRARAVATLALCLALSACGGGSSAGTKAPPKRLPDVTLQAFQGSGSLDLGTLRGPAVINLWASWCGPCKRELPQYEAFNQEYGRRIKVIGVDFKETSTANARALARSTRLSYPLYADPDGALKAIGLPKLILVDAKGHVVFEKYVEIITPDDLRSYVEQDLPGVLS